MVTVDRDHVASDVCSSEDDVVSTATHNVNVSVNVASTIDNVVACAHQESPVWTIEVCLVGVIRGITVKVFVACQVVVAYDIVVTIVTFNAAIAISLAWLLVSSFNPVIAFTTIDFGESCESILAIYLVVAILASDLLASRSPDNVIERDRVNCVIAWSSFNVESSDAVSDEYCVIVILAIDICGSPEVTQVNLVVAVSSMYLLNS